MIRRIVCSVPEVDPDHVFGPFEAVDPLLMPRTVEKAADDYHSNHDGWECGWPLEFDVWDYDTEEYVGRYSVDRETVPQFHATLNHSRKGESTRGIE